MILLIQESSESDSEVVKVKKKKEKPSYDTQIVDIKEQFTWGIIGSNSKAAKPKKTKKSLW